LFLRRHKKSQWANTDIATGDLAEEIIKLKSQNGRDIIVYGGASFDSSLIKEGKDDDFHLFINPAAIGKGMTIFKDLNEIQRDLRNSSASLRVKENLTKADPYLTTK
jgi:dihydrofolate reductase